jgi:hypothetical protein
MTDKLNEWKPGMVLPLPKKEWVGLTFEEVNQIARALRWHPVERDYIMANAIEAKLKEKNT